MSATPSRPTRAQATPTAPSPRPPAGTTTDSAEPPPDRATEPAATAPSDLPPPEVTPLPDDRFLNRELSWLDFNARVLTLAEDAGTPLLERAKFLAIFASNLDEFFMVRISGLRRRVQAGLPARAGRPVRGRTNTARDGGAVGGVGKASGAVGGVGKASGAVGQRRDGTGGGSATGAG